MSSRRAPRRLVEEENLDTAVGLISDYPLRMGSAAGHSRQAAAAAPATGAWLFPLAGPPIRAIALKHKDGGLLVGRHDAADVRLPSDAVSRNHARLRFESGRWMICDLKSRWGTFLNGCRIKADVHIPLQS